MLKSQPQMASSRIILPQVACAFHPSQYITNFCICESCLLPLCPSCIKIHTIEHISLKKTNPSYEPINQLTMDIYKQVQELLQTFNQDYRKINQLNIRIQGFKTGMFQKIFMIKSQLIGEIEKHFAKLAQETQKRINQMDYMNKINEYKDQTKKIILNLKNIERSFSPDNDKMMRTVIKYKGGLLKQELYDVHEKMGCLFSKTNFNFATFAVRDNFRENLSEYLQRIHKIQIHDIQGINEVDDISEKLREVYEKSAQTDKSEVKEIRRSIGDLMGKKQESKVLQKQHISRLDSQEQIQPRRKSLSRGKGLSVLQANNFFNSCSKKSKVRAINITQPPDLNKTSFIRKPDFF